jgi:hypothetical protein
MPDWLLTFGSVRYMALGEHEIYSIGESDKICNWIYVMCKLKHK